MGDIQRNFNAAAYLKGMKQITTHVSRLRGELVEIEAQIIELLDKSRIEKQLRQPNPFQVIESVYNRVPIDARVSYSWSKLPSNDEAFQTRILSRYEEWFRAFSALFRSAGQTRQREITITHNSILSWIKYRHSGQMPTSIPEAAQECKKSFQPFVSLLDELDAPTEQSLILVPDTNVLIDYPDVTTYAPLFERDEYSVVVLPTIVSELDKLKRLRNDKERRGKVSAAIRYLKEWRTLSDANPGVTKSGKIMLRMIAKEPNFGDAPSWLDPTNNDDRIIAATLEIQRENPGATIIIVSNDMNMQNKATMAGLPCVEMHDDLNDKDS